MSILCEDVLENLRKAIPCFMTVGYGEMRATANAQLDSKPRALMAVPLRQFPTQRGFSASIISFALIFDICGFANVFK